MTKAQAVQQRRKGEVTVRYIKHDPYCLFSDGLITPKYRCTCGSKKYAYCNVLDSRKAKK